MNNCPRCGSSNTVVEEGRTSRLVKKAYNIAMNYRKGNVGRFVVEVLFVSILGEILLSLIVPALAAISSFALFSVLFILALIVFGWDTWVVHIRADKMICKDCHLNWIVVKNRPWPTAEEAMQQHLVLIGEKTPWELAREEKIENRNKSSNQSR
jgi:hypothetical protein